MEGKPFTLLLHGFDTVQCSYYLQTHSLNALDFQLLGEKREVIRQTKRKNPLPIILGNTEFLLQPYGSSSGYPFIIENGDFKIEFGQFNKPNFFVTFRSRALWHETAFRLHEKYLQWAASVGYWPYREEKLSRVDYSFDYDLPEIDFDDDCFVSRSTKDNRHREHKKPQTFAFGKGDVMLRVYNKVAEIRQQSEKVWFFPLWGQEENVWRIEWQVRKDLLKSFQIRTFADLKERTGDLLRYLAEDHDTLRRPNEDSNSSRWPLHPLWEDLQEHIRNLDHVGVTRGFDENAVLEQRKMQIAVAVYGYLKRTAAIFGVQRKEEPMDAHDALVEIGEYILFNLHEPHVWTTDVEKRMKEMQLGAW